MKGIKGLLDSRKAVMVILMLAGLTYLLIAGHLDQTHYAGAIAVIKSFWLTSHSYEESAKAKAGADLIDKAADAALRLKLAGKNDDGSEKG